MLTTPYKLDKWEVPTTNNHVSEHELAGASRTYTTVNNSVKKFQSSLDTS